MDTKAALDRAAGAIATADALLVTAGAGMGVDSGLPDFRGPEGFWRAYPPYRALGLRFEELADPAWFRSDPALAWGFYGHRLELYRSTRPHQGFALLRRWAASRRQGFFVFTTNVDGQFQRAGFPEESIVEHHGSLSWLQCLEECGAGIFPAAGVRVEVDPETFRATGGLPRCPACGALARPNVLMFGDMAWDPERTQRQRERLAAWLHGLRGSSVVVVELGAGTSIPSARSFGEWVAATPGRRLVRINPREAQAPAGQISVPLGALEAIRAIEARLSAPGPTQHRRDLEA